MHSPGGAGVWRRRPRRASRRKTFVRRGDRTDLRPGSNRRHARVVTIAHERIGVRLVVRLHDAERAGPMAMAGAGVGAPRHAPRPRPPTRSIDTKEAVTTPAPPARSEFVPVEIRPWRPGDEGAVL